MNHISFAWTTPQVLKGEKDVTRRNWAESHAQKFMRCVEKKSPVIGLDKDYRAGGAQVVVIMINDVRLEPLSRLIEEPEYGIDEMRREGYPGRDPMDFFSNFKVERKDGQVYRVEFRVEKLTEFGERLLKKEAA